MSFKGEAKPNPPRLIRLACGHMILFYPPLPSTQDELTCGRCGEPTVVTTSPRRWTA